MRGLRGERVVDERVDLFPKATCVVPIGVVHGWDGGNGEGKAKEGVLG